MSCRVHRIVSSQRSYIVCRKTCTDNINVDEDLSICDCLLSARGPGGVD